MTGPADEARPGLLERLPEGGAFLLLTVAPGDDPDEAAAEALRAAMRVGSARPHTMLAGVGPPGAALDRCLEATGPGLEAVYRGEATLAEVATPVPGGRLVYLPSGVQREEEDGEAGASGDVAPRARRLAEVLRRGRATLVLLLEEAAAGRLEAEGDLTLSAAEAVRRLEAEAGQPEAPPTDGSAPAAGAEGRSDSETAGPGSAAADPADGGADRAPGSGWSRRRRGSPAGRIVGVALVAAGVVAGAWLVTRAFGRAEPESGVPARTTAGSGGGRPASSDPGRETHGPHPAETPAAADRTPTGVGSGNASTAPARVGPTLEARAEQAPALPYSVLIASYSTKDDAAHRAQRWSADDGILYVVAPTPVQGRIYYRVLAGALPDRGSASRLMDRLVALGRKEQASAWDVRPASLAFRLGVRATRREAAARADSAAAEGIPAYVLPAAAAGDTAWQVYAGAFESGDAGAALARMLARAGEDTTLVTRRGTTGR